MVKRKHLGSTESPVDHIADPEKTEEGSRPESPPPVIPASSIHFSLPTLLTILVIVVGCAYWTFTEFGKIEQSVADLRTDLEKRLVELERHHKNGGQ